METFMSAVATKPRSISFRVSDLTRQRSAYVEEIESGFTIGEVLPTLLEQLSLPTSDSSGPLTHAIRRDSDGAILADSDFVDELDQEEAVIQPSVNAGAQ
jgi:hypothetical protein